MAVKFKTQINYKPYPKGHKLHRKEVISTTYYLDINHHGIRRKEFFEGGAIKEDETPAVKRILLDAVKRWHIDRVNKIVNLVADLPVSYAQNTPILPALNKYEADNPGKKNKAMLAGARKWFTKYAKPAAVFGNVNEHYVQGFVDYMFDEGLSGMSITHYWGVVKDFLTVMHREEVCRYDVAKFTPELPDIDSEEREWLELDELERLAATPCRDNRVKTAFLFACYAGRDFGDVFILEDRFIEGDVIVFDRKKLATKKNRSKQQKTLRKKKPKGAAEKLLHPVALELIRQATRTADGKYIFDLPSRGAGVRQCNKMFNRILQDWVDEAKIDKKITSHSARHTFASIAEGDSYSLTDHSPDSKAGKRYRHETKLKQEKVLKSIPAVDINWAEAK